MEKEFTLELIGRKELAPILESQKERVIDRAKEFRFSYLVAQPSLLEDETARNVFVRREINHSSLSNPAPFKWHEEEYHYTRLLNFFWEVEKANYWATLQLLDGVSYRHCDGKDAHKERCFAKGWSRDTFNHDQLQELLTISINQALLAPYGIGGQPARARGHSILLSDLVEGHSQFQSVVTQPFLKRLVNGSFWEHVGNGVSNYDSRVIINEVELVLTKYASLLDPSLVEQGIILSRRNNDAHGGRGSIDTSLLSKEAQGQYFSFVEKCQKRLSRDDYHFLSGSIPGCL